MGCQISQPQLSPQVFDRSPCPEITHSKRVAQQGRTDSYIGEPSPCLEASKQERQRILRERVIGLGQEEIFLSVTPSYRKPPPTAMLIQIGEHLMQPLRRKRKFTLSRPVPPNQ